MPLRVHETRRAPGASPARRLTEARRFAAQYSHGILVVDALQGMRPRLDENGRATAEGELAVIEDPLIGADAEVQVRLVVFFEQREPEACAGQPQVLIRRAVAAPLATR